jgi:palmitoyltransferase
MDAKVGEEVVIDRERLHLEKPSWKAKTIVEKMTENKRYCRICEFYQPLRVRHCHSCEQCVATFDHHCPWLSTCIGEKNKLAFIGYLFAQTLQFLVISIDLIRYLSVSRSESAPVGILLLAVILIFIVLLLLLIFHIYLAANNLTTCNNPFIQGSYFGGTKYNTFPFSIKS